MYVVKASGFFAPLWWDLLFFLQVMQRETEISMMTMAANKTMTTMTMINMENFMHVTPSLLGDELAMGSLIIAPEGMIDR